MPASVTLLAGAQGSLAPESLFSSLPLKPPWHAVPSPRVQETALFPFLLVWTT